MRVYGSQGYAHIDDAKRTKLESKRFLCIFLGYAANTKSFRVYDLEISKFVISRFVKLDEREVNGVYDMVVPEKELIFRYIRGSDEAVGSVGCPPDKDEPLENVDENSAPDIEIGSIPYKTGIGIPQLPVREHRIATGGEMTVYQAPIQYSRKTRYSFK